jgi:hypothetical protein
LERKENFKITKSYSKMSTSLETLFTSHQSIYINSILTELISYIKENIEFVNEQETSTVVNKVLTELNITQSQQPASKLGVTPKVATNVIPLNPLAAPAPKKATTGKGGKTAKAQQRNITIDEYKLEFAQRKPVCAYAPNRGDHLGRVCAAPASDASLQDPNPLTWRCLCCGTKKGIIDKHMNNSAVVGGQKVGGVSGFNHPKATNLVPPFVPAPTIAKHHPPASTNALFGATAQVEQVDDEILVMINESAPNYYFSNEENKFGYVFIETESDGIICIGKLLDENGSPFVTTIKVVLPDDWQSSLQELDEDDLNYIKSIKTTYDFGKLPEE